MGSWEVLDEGTGALTLEYSFKANSTSRAFAARFDGDEIVILSPPLGVDAAVYRELEHFGRVTALVAPNGLHWMGLRPALEVFPDARVYAPAPAQKRVAKKAPDLQFHPLAELCARAQGKVRILEVPGFSIGETWAVADGEAGPIWYTSDSCLNMQKLPGSFFIRSLFTWSKSAPGLRINALSNMFFLKDKPAYKGWFEAQLANAPATLVPAHGDVARLPDLGSALREQLAQRL
jgi:hypothetical protein